MKRLFPLRETLKKLYDALCIASSFSNNEFYRNFDINDARNIDTLILKARTVFSEFDIVAYSTKNGAWLWFDRPLNDASHLEQNLKQIKLFLLKQNNDDDSECYWSCLCETKIVHGFIVRSRVTKEEVYPVGSTCIFKFSDTDTARIMEEVTKSISKNYTSDERKRMQKKLELMQKEDKTVPMKKKRRTHEEQMESKRMKQEDKTIRKKKQICDETCCPCKILSERNKIELDPLLFNISKINSKKYMNDYMKALNISHIFVYL